MVSDELNFCTDCGAQNKADNEFCIGCGVRLKSGLVAQVKETPAVFAGVAMPSSRTEEVIKTASLLSRKNLVILVAAVLVSFIVGAGLASENVFSGIIGDRYTEKRLKNEKQQSYTIGYKSGEDAGYDVGYQRGNSYGYASGYSTGVSDGCNKVFDRVGSEQLIAIFYPYRSLNIGRYYSTRSDTC